ncbi:MAG: hypothetical protein NTX26_03415 [Candidatus Parcubacteria bacterium]|nr:hypothetical protein [Candidatus Parcubacteria bacterium]
MVQSIFSQLLLELQTNKNHEASIERCKVIIKELEKSLDKRIIAYFSSEVGNDAGSMVNDEDDFLIENLLSIPSDKKDLVLVLHSNGGFSPSAERIIDVCKNYCTQRDDGSKFYVIVPKKAKSAATIVALGSDKIYLRDTAELGPVDPQFMIADKDGNIQVEPAYLYVDALENIFDNTTVRIFKKYFNKNNNNKSLSKLPNGMKLKLLEQCNYAMFVHAQNELGLSDSIIAKISKDKIKQYPNICPEDFDIFKDPHVTRSHGRLINFSDLENNTLRTEKIIERLGDIFEDKNKFKNFDNLLWELYVRKKQLVNDPGNNIVKTIESTEEFFVTFGMKQGQIKKSPQSEEPYKEKTTEVPK